MATYCSNCGTEINNSDSFCPTCGQKSTAVKVAPVRGQKKIITEGLVGWSNYTYSPEMIRIISKKKKQYLLAGFVYGGILFVILNVVGFLTESLGQPTGFFIGSGIALFCILMGIKASLKVKTKERRTWDGQVIDKYEKSIIKRRMDTDIHDEEITTYTVEVQKQNGEIIRVTRDNSCDTYLYFNVGDYVRYHALFDKMEKYDKSKDKEIPCIACGYVNDIGQSHCDICHAPLLK